MGKSSEHFFYVLQCSDGSYYGGYTTDVVRREKEHNAGIRCKYTKTRRPVKMIHFEKFTTRSEATKAESYFKHLTRRAKEVYLAKEEKE
ncbi:GIY-YIG nuclease family protein [Listeria sp. PSOL-1]|uniref:GIY-YIG nuclease family protein n=1 Tax=Listeria sp. PSOL-1 TaxID=1844999 RepID=UPI0013D8D953|nr:GIY-YIG nuclease family protein [Listeria sp. PSOL-1]